MKWDFFIFDNVCDHEEGYIPQNKPATEDEYYMTSFICELEGEYVTL